MLSVRLLRVMLGINQQTLCEASGVSRQALSLYETGAQFPSRRAAALLDRAIVDIIDKRVMKAVQEMHHPPAGVEATATPTPMPSNVVPLGSATAALTPDKQGGR